MRRRRSGLLHEVHPGVYAWGHAGLTLRGRFLAATKAAGPGAALSHCSACFLWRLIAWDETWLPEVTIPMRGPRRVPGVTIHRTRVPFEIVRLDGIPVTLPARAAVDLATVLPYKAVRRAVREGMALKRIAVKDLVAIRGRRGAHTIRRILADGYVPTRSEFEDVVLDLLDRGGFPRPDVNTPITGRRPAHGARFPLAGQAPGARGRRPPMARLGAGARRRRRASGASRGRGRTRAARHLGAGDHPPGPDERARQGGVVARCQAATEAASRISLARTIRSTSARGKRRATRSCSVCSGSRSPATSSVARQMSTGWLLSP